MEAFLHINCFTLVTFLYLIVTWELPQGAICSKSKPMSVSTGTLPTRNTDDVTSTNKVGNLLYVSESLSSISSPFHATSELSKVSSTLSVSSPRAILSYSQLSVATLSSTFLENLSPQSSRNAKRKVTRNNSSRNINADRNDIFLNLANNNKTFSQHSPSPYFSTSSSKQDDDDNGISASQSNHPSGNTNAVSNDDYKQMEETDITPTLAERRNSSSNNKRSKLVMPPGKSSQPTAIQRERSKKVAANAAVGPFPVAYLMNSHYQLESLPISKNPFDSGDDRSHERISRDVNENSDLLPRISKGSTPAVTKMENLALPLQNSDIEDNINSEISLDLTTLSPATASDAVTSPLSSDERESTSSSDNTSSTNEPNDEEKSMINNQTTGTTPLRGKCNETLQCFGEHVECRLGICKCQLGFLPRIDNGELCGLASAHHVEIPTTDPTMIGVVVGLALMSVTLCVVLRLFAKARFRENRTIFNTPNPRLMNVSLLKGSKTLLRGNSGGGHRSSRRGSQASVGSGQIEGQTPVNTAPDGNVTSTAAGSSHPHRVKPSRTLSTDTANHEGTAPSSKPISSTNRSKFRQDSVASNV